MSQNALVQKERKEELTPERMRNAPTFSPRVDICENDEELVLYADLPGVEPEDIDIRFERGELSIYGKCKPRHQGTHLLNEFEVGDFYRAFSIYEEVDADRISAELKNGVLTVHLPKSDAVKPKRISVKAS
ncbi:MAG: heat-shock protein [Gemmatales bacterium]|nr:MAG: heat-shock protein [Gemmatales bacterium]